jgi:hypothetical protein
MPEEYRFEADIGVIRVTRFERPRSRAWDPVVEEIKVYTWMDHRPGEDFAGFWARMRGINTEIVASLEDCEGRGQLAIVPTPESGGDGLTVEAPDPYVVAVVSASAGVAAKEIVSVVVASIRAVLAKRRDAEGEHWREPGGYV